MGIATNLKSGILSMTDLTEQVPLPSVIELSDLLQVDGARCRTDEKEWGGSTVCQGF